MERLAVASPHVWDLAGVIDASDFSGKDHDAILYGGPASADRPGAADQPASVGAEEAERSRAR
jgi:hypothetical protein